MAELEENKSLMLRMISRKKRTKETMVIAVLLLNSPLRERELLFVFRTEILLEFTPRELQICSSQC